MIIYHLCTVTHSVFVIYAKLQRPK